MEGAFLVISRLHDVAWDATEQLSFDEVEAATDPFKLVFRLLDELYQYEDLIEVPSRCDEFFSDFSRKKGEELQAYLIRHRTLLKRMREVNVEVPPLLSGWHLLTRAGVPRWTHVQIKAMCSGDLEYEKVGKALIRMFGGDHVPNARDLGARSTTSSKEEVYVEEEDEWYDDADGYANDGDWYDDEAFEADEYEEDEEPIPEELEEAMELTDEAYVSYIESRKRMKELALSRGFYPVVALGPDYDRAGGRPPKGEGKGGKGKGKSGGKGKSKGKGKGGGFMRRTPFHRRPMSGLRRPPSSPSTTTSIGDKSTLTGSTSQHGPRFKRYRSQAAGVKEVPEEITMVEETNVTETTEVATYEQVTDEQCFFAVAERGKAIVDSGATRTIVGEENWHRWLEAYGNDQTKPVILQNKVRHFKFGGGETLRSDYEVEFTAIVHGQALPVTASVVPGSTPFLLARPTLEQWGVVHDYKENRMKIGDSDWITPERNERGHFILDLMMYEDTYHIEEIYYQMDEGEQLGVDDDAKLLEEGPFDAWDIEPSMEVDVSDKDKMKETEEVMMADDLAERIAERLRSEKKLKFFEVYVDKGNLAVHLAKKNPDVESSTFSLPEWDFSQKAVREEFVSLLREVSPDFVWIAPPCKKWSSMQRLNRRTLKQRKELEERRNEEEHSHLSLVEDVATVCKEIDSDYAMEHPHGAESWDTETLQSMRGYFEGICNRCRTGLYYKDEHQEGPVRKQTRVRTSSREVAEALNLPCTCTKPHVQMDGKSRALHDMQNYEAKFTQIAGKAIYKVMDDNWMKKEIAKILVAEETEEEKKTKKVTDEEMKRSKTQKSAALSIVAKLHRQLGHPGRDRLLVALRESGMNEEIIEAAKGYTCDICQNFINKKPAKPSSLPQAQKFNELLEMDVFHIKWDDKKLKVLAIIDVFSRYEMNAAVEAETEKAELSVLDSWINVFGCPQKIKTDASGGHMSEAFLSYMDDRNIKLILVPKDAHYKMGIVERLHAVRRMQLLKMKMEKPTLSLDVAAPIACSMRNQLRSIHGSSPSQIVFGTNAQEAGLMDEPVINAADPSKRHQEVRELRVAAAKSFYEANYSHTLRKALLSQSRAVVPQYFPGEWVYYWREGDSKLEVSRWRGPALVCSSQPREADEAGPRPDVYWLAHGTSLLRVSHTSLRPEAPRERQARLQYLPQTARVRDVQDTVRAALHPVRGPVRFLDLLGDPPFSDAKDEPETDSKPDDPHEQFPGARRQQR